MLLLSAPLWDHPTTVLSQLWPTTDSQHPARQACCYCQRPSGIIRPQCCLNSGQQQTSNTQQGKHVVTVSAPLGSSDHSVVSTLANYRLPTPSKAGMLLLSAPLWDHPTTVLSQPWPTTDFQHPARQACCYCQRPSGIIRPQCCLNPGQLQTSNTQQGNPVVTVSAPLGSSDYSVVSTLANYRLPTPSKTSMLLLSASLWDHPTTVLSQPWPTTDFQHPARQACCYCQRPSGIIRPQCCLNSGQPQTSNTQQGKHVVTVSAPLGSSDHSVVSTLANYRLPTPSKAGMLLMSAPLWDHPTTVLSQPWPTTDFQHPARQACCYCQRPSGIIRPQCCLNPGQLQTSNTQQGNPVVTVSAPLGSSDYSVVSTLANYRLPTPSKTSMLLLSASLWDHPTTVLSQPWPTTDFQQPARQACCYCQRPSGIIRPQCCLNPGQLQTSNTQQDKHVVTVSAPLGSSDHSVVSTLANYRLPTPSKTSMLLLSAPLWDHPTTVLSQLWPTTDFQHPARQACCYCQHPSGIIRPQCCLNPSQLQTSNTQQDKHVVTVSAPLGSPDHSVVSTLANYRLPTPSKAGMLLLSAPLWDHPTTVLSQL